MVSVKRENGFVWWTDASGFHNVKSHFFIHCSWAMPAPQMRMVSRQSAPFRNFVVSATWHAVCGLNRFKLYRRNRVGITHCSASFCVVFCGFVPREGTAVFPRQSILSPNPIPLVYSIFPLLSQLARNASHGQKCVYSASTHIAIPAMACCWFSKECTAPVSHQFLLLVMLQHCRLHAWANSRSADVQLHRDIRLAASVSVASIPRINVYHGDFRFLLHCESQAFALHPQHLSPHVLTLC